MVGACPILTGEKEAALVLRFSPDERNELTFERSELTLSYLVLKTPRCLQRNVTGLSVSSDAFFVALTN